MKTKACVSGVLNGANFTAEGTGVWDPARGICDGVLTFQMPLHRASPMMCSSWKCKDHSALAPMPDGSQNPLGVLLDQGVTLVYTTHVVYPVVGGEIDCVAHVRREGGVQIVEQTRLGTYHGPLDIVRQHGYFQDVSLVRPGLAVGDYTRYVETADGTMILVQYYEQIRIPNDVVFEPFRITYNVLAASFDGRVFKLTMAPEAAWRADVRMPESSYVAVNR